MEPETMGIALTLIGLGFTLGGAALLVWVVSGIIERRIDRRYWEGVASEALRGFGQILAAQVGHGGAGQWPGSHGLRNRAEGLGGL